MSRRLPVLTGKDLARIVERHGFEFRRQKGSHAIVIRSRDKARVVIPMHSGVSIKRKTLSGIIEYMKITVEEFNQLL